MFEIRSYVYNGEALTQEQFVSRFGEKAKANVERMVTAERSTLYNDWYFDRDPDSDLACSYPTRFNLGHGLVVEAW